MDANNSGRINVKVNKKGFLLYELFIAFTFISVIMVVMLQTTINIKNQQQRMLNKTLVRNFKADLMRSLGQDLKALKIVSITPLSTPCSPGTVGDKNIDITYQAVDEGPNFTRRLVVDAGSSTTENKLAYGPIGAGEVVKLDKQNLYITNVTATRELVGGIAIYKINVIFNLTDYNFSLYNQTTGTTGNIYKENILNGNDPIWEGTNLLPIKRNAGNTAWISAIGDTEWYNYSEKRWANAVVLTTNSSQPYCYYLNNPGTIVAESNIAFYFVWIPRYKYAIPVGAGPRTISVEFENGKATTGMGDGVGTNYLTHPGFDFGGPTNGFWVAKFEPTGTINSLTVKPNLSPVYSDLSTAFQRTRSLKTTYNLVGEPYLLKNSQWGAIAYLSHSNYGINGEVRINNSSVTYTNSKTGCAATTSNAAGVTNCSNSYETSTGQLASTTGNITGVYDMNGGMREQMMARVQNYDSENPSGFIGNCYDSNSEMWIGCGTVSMPSSAYYDTYQVVPVDAIHTNTTTACGGSLCNGHALKETLNWYSDASVQTGGDAFLTVYNTWISRGGRSYEQASAGIFNYAPGPGGSDNFIHSYSFRIVFTP